MMEKLQRMIFEVMFLAGVVGAFVVFFIVAKKLLLLGCG